MGLGNVCGVEQVVLPGKIEEITTEVDALKVAETEALVNPDPVDTHEYTRAVAMNRNWTSKGLRANAGARFATSFNNNGSDRLLVNDGYEHLGTSEHCIRWVLQLIVDCVKNTESEGAKTGGAADGDFEVSNNLVTTRATGNLIGSFFNSKGIESRDIAVVAAGFVQFNVL